MTTIEKAVQWAISTANDNSHGYSQQNRWGNPDYDCSSFVISAWEYAGVHVRNAGASYTGNMRGAFLSCGFVDVTNQVGISSGYGIQAGDVLLNYAAHTCMSIGGGKVANCRTSEGNTQGGDQSGNEIRIQSYWDGSPNKWNCVLRYKGKEATQPSAELTKPNGDKNDYVNHSWKPELLKYGAKGSGVLVLQAVLVAKKFFVNNDRKEIDGDYGAKTQAAVNSAKQFYGMLANGECDLPLWKRLMDVG